MTLIFSKILKPYNTLVGCSSFSASETSVASEGASSAQFSGTAQKYRDEKRAGKYALGCSAVLYLYLKGERLLSLNICLSII